MSNAPFIRAEPEVRRLGLIDATARVLAARGIAGASVRTIAREAGVSPGLVGHHFDGIDDLVGATYRHVARQVNDQLDAAVTGAGGSPRARLNAYVTASFAPGIADPELLATWLAFWSLVRAKPQIATLHDETYGSYRATLEGLLADCGVAPADLRLTAIAIAALVDGLWLELCLSPNSFTAEEACRIAIRHVGTIVPRVRKNGGRGKD